MGYDPYRRARGMSRNQSNGRFGYSMGAQNGSQNRPGCGVPAPYPPGMQPNCPTQGVTYCFSHLGGNVTAQAAGTFAIIITPVNVVEFVPRWFTVAFFETGTSTENNNALINSIVIKGDDQLSGGPVGINAFNERQTVLEVNWRTATPQNPITVSLTHTNVTAMDVRLVVAGDAYK